MKLLVKVLFAVSLLLVLTLGYSSTVFVENTEASCNAECHRLTYWDVINTLRFQDPLTIKDWNNCDAACVNGVLKDNKWWLSPLSDTLNEISNSQDFSLEVVSKYALVYSADFGRTLEEECKQNKIRDMRPKFPTKADFDQCAMTQGQWVTNYTRIIDGTKGSFDVPPPLFRIDRWADDRYFLPTKKYGGPS